MDRWSSKVVPAFCIALALAIIPATATAVALQFEAVVTSVDVNQDDVSVGDTITGSIVFDASIATTLTSTATDLELAIDPPLPIGSIQMMAGANALAPDGGTELTFFIRDADSGPDLLVVVGRVSSAIFAGAAPIPFQLELRDEERAGISGVALPSSLNLNDFSDDFARITFSASRTGITGQLTSLTYVVPEPGPGLLVFLGVGMASLLRRCLVATLHRDSYDQRSQCGDEQKSVAYT
ncbi:MAG: PEP-CTERM sorting domain-containing protein [Myxococcota bacterium]